MEPPRPPGAPAISPLEIAALAAWIADQKKGTDIRVHDVSEYLKVADYFVLITGHSRPHVRALAEEIRVQLKAQGEERVRIEGADLGWWILMDYGNVVVHVLQPEARAYYDLDALYAPCPAVDVRGVALPAVDLERRATV